MTSRVVYIAGPMRGHPDFNFPAFFAAEGRLREEDPEVIVFNPARRDEAVYGPGIGRNPYGDETVAAAQYGFDLREALAADLAFVCQDATEVYMLRGWSESRGATAERAAAIALDLTVTYEDDTERQTESEEYWYDLGYDDGAWRRDHALRGGFHDR